MSSLTKQTEKIRHRKHKRAGADRKKAIASKGTTPVFPIHKTGEKPSPSES